MENELTTISLSPGTKDKLEKLKIHPNQSFEEIILELLEKKR